MREYSSATVSSFSVVLFVPLVGEGGGVDVLVCVFSASFCSCCCWSRRKALRVEEEGVGKEEVEDEEVREEIFMVLL